MDSPSDRLNNFLARSGAGVDAAGRTVYSGPGMMYSGPAEFARTQQVHNQLMADESRHDSAAALIRQLLDELRKRSPPGQIGFDPPPLPPPGNVSINYRDE